ncbi:MAG: glycosyltransferase family 25 protein [Paracoccaceae bacterium]
MDIYLINLEVRPERLAFMHKQLSARNLPYQRITAVDGLGTQDIGYPAAHPRLSKPEYACYLSHVKCWERFVHSGAPICLILEDDVALGARFSMVLGHPAFFNHGACVTKLETRVFPMKLSRKRYMAHEGISLRRHGAYEGGTAAYVITRAYAQYMLQYYRIPYQPVDDQLLDEKHSTFKGHTILQLDPAVALQQIFLDTASKNYDVHSDLQAQRVAPEPVHLNPGIIHKILRRYYRVWKRIFYKTALIPFDEE